MTRRAATTPHRAGWASSSSGWLRHLLTNEWRVPYRKITAADVRAGRLTGVDVLLTPDGSATDAAAALGPAGRDRLTTWAKTGGHHVGWRGGTELAASLGITTAALTESTADLPHLRRPARLTVRAADEQATRSLLDRYDLRYQVRRDGDIVRLAIANPAEAGADDLPWLDPLVRDLRSGPVEVVAFIAP